MLLKILFENTYFIFQTRKLCDSNILNLWENCPIWYSATLLKDSERGKITEEANAGLFENFTIKSKFLIPDSLDSTHLQLNLLPKVQLLKAYLVPKNHSYLDLIFFVHSQWKHCKMASCLFQRNHSIRFHKKLNNVTNTVSFYNKLTQHSHRIFLTSQIYFCKI